MAIFSDFPIEINTKILKKAWEASLAWTSPHVIDLQWLLIDVGLKPKPSFIWFPSIYGFTDPKRITLFSFKAVRVCSLWRDIVSTWRDAWDLVVFDLQDDPTPRRVKKITRHSIPCPLFHPLRVHKVPCDVHIPTRTDKFLPFEIYHDESLGPPNLCSRKFA